MNGIFGAEISLMESLLVTGICMAIVFIILLIIAGILSLFKYIPAEAKVEKNMAKKQTAQAPAKVETKAFDPNSVTDERMVVAMLVASMEAASENDGAYIKVRNIREI
ncbi:MAG: OadG family transporter subunit [Fusobacteriaceae bacterium]